MTGVSMPKQTPSVLLLVLLGVASLSAGCRKKTALPAPPSELDDPSAQESTEPTVSASKPAQERCRETNPGTLFAVGDADTSKRSDTQDPVDGEESDEPIAMPFGVELGGVTGYKAGFATGLLQSRRQGQRASVALIRADGSGRTVELDAVHGDVEAPFVASAANELVVLFGDQDAAGATLRTALVPFDAERASFGPELLSVDRASGAALAVSGESALIAYSELTRGKSQFATVRFDLHEKKLAARVAIDTQKRDVESPRLCARPGGFWLGWVEQLPAPTTKAAPKNKPQGDDTNEERAGLELGPRALRLVSLDAAGKPQGAPLSLTKADSHVLSFELAPWPDGGAVLAWRDDPAAPGVEGGALQLAHVRPDGSVETGQVEGELGAGVPSLLVDSEPRSPGSVVWLAAGGGSEATRFGLLTGNGTSVTELTDDRRVGLAELVGVRGGRLLAARPRQTAQDLFVLECAPK
jgi:hypothetical protein